MKRILLRAGVLLFSLSVATLLILQAAAPAGCGGGGSAHLPATKAGPVIQTPAQHVDTQQAQPQYVPPPQPVAEPANAIDPRFLPASKAGPVFVPPPSKNQNPPPSPAAQQKPAPKIRYMPATKAGPMLLPEQAPPQQQPSPEQVQQKR